MGARTSDARLLLPAALVWASTWLVVGLPDLGLPPALAPLVLWGGALVCLGASARSDGRRRAIAATALVACASAALVATVAGVALHARETGPLAGLAETHGTAEVVVELSATPRAMHVGAGAPAWAAAASAGRMRADGRAVAVDGRAIRALPVTVEFDAGAARPAFGSTVRLPARVAELPAGERSAFRLRGTATAVVGPPPWWAGWASPLRAGLVEAASRLGGDGGALVPGLAVGDTSAVGDELDQAMKSSSLSHLTAVSGDGSAVLETKLNSTAFVTFS